MQCHKTGGGATLRTDASVIDEVGPWTEVKVEIVREYAQLFLTITGKHPYFERVYLDGFAGSGIMKSKTSGDHIQATPARILAIEPGFNEYHFIEMVPDRRALLESVIGSVPNVTIYGGDSNEILLNRLLPTMTFDSYRKGLLFLDPHHLQVDWRVVEAAGKSGCIDLLLNFPIHDINRNALRGDPSLVLKESVATMNWFCGSEGWRDVVYREDEDLFGNITTKKRRGNDPIVQWYSQQLKDVAGFQYVSTALPMTNEKNAPVYYLIGASQKPQAVSVFNSVFKKWRKRGVRVVPAEFHRVD